MNEPLTPEQKKRIVDAIDAEFAGRKTAWFFACAESDAGPFVPTSVATNAMERKISLPMWLRRIARGFETGQLR